MTEYSGRLFHVAPPLPLWPHLALFICVTELPCCHALAPRLADVDTPSDEDDGEGEMSPSVTPPPIDEGYDEPADGPSGTPPPDSDSASAGTPPLHSDDNGSSHGKPGRSFTPPIEEQRPTVVDDQTADGDANSLEDAAVSGSTVVNDGVPGPQNPNDRASSGSVDAGRTADDASTPFQSDGVAMHNDTDDVHVPDFAADVSTLTISDGERSEDENAEPLTTQSSEAAANNSAPPPPTSARHGDIPEEVVFSHDPVHPNDDEQDAANVVVGVNDGGDETTSTGDGRKGDKTPGRGSPESTVKHSDSSADANNDHAVQLGADQADTDRENGTAFKDDIGGLQPDSKNQDGDNQSQACDNGNAPVDGIRVAQQQLNGDGTNPSDDSGDTPGDNDDNAQRQSGGRGTSQSGNGGDTPNDDGEGAPQESGDDGKNPSGGNGGASGLPIECSPSTKLHRTAGSAADSIG